MNKLRYPGALQFLAPFGFSRGLRTTRHPRQRFLITMPFFQHKTWRLVLTCLVMVAMILGGAVDADAKTKKKKKAAPTANHKYAALVMDADTGMILFERNPDKSLHPASLTKVMTLLLAFDAMQNGTLSPHDRIRISPYAASMSPSKLGLKAGSTIRVEDAIYALVTKSANDISVALAEALGGSEQRFAKMMTARAQSIGMTKSRFYNASGLPDSRQFSSARDMAILARYIISTYPRQYRYFSAKSFTYGGRTHRNHNRLMETYSGMDGMKTGYVNASGFNLVASAKRGNQRLIGVVFGGQSTVSRNNHMAEILDNGFRQMNDMRIAQARAPKTDRAQTAYTPEVAAATTALAARGTPARAATTDDLAQTAPAAGMGAMAETAGAQDHPLQADPIQSVALRVPPSAIPAPPPSKPPVVSALTARTIAPPSRAVPDRFLTGMLAVNAHRSALNGAVAPRPVPVSPQRVSLTPTAPTAPPALATPGQRDWSIQIGAYQSRLATDQALYQALRKLPGTLSQAQALIVPMRTADATWVFRARLGGFTSAQAVEACRYFSPCMTVAPDAR